MQDDYDKCPKCTLNPDSMIASCTSEGCPIWKNPIATKAQVDLFPLGFDQTPVDASKSFFTPKVKTMSLPDGMIAVDAISLRRVLQALNGSMHLIRELQVTRGNPNLPSLVTDVNGKPYVNPIDTLIKNYNDSIKS